MYEEGENINHIRERSRARHCHTEAMTLFPTSESHLDSYHRREIEC